MTVDEKLTAVLQERQTALATSQEKTRQLQQDVNLLTNIQNDLVGGTLSASRARRLVEFLGGI